MKDSFISLNFGKTFHLFASQKEVVRRETEAIRKERLGQSAIGLSNSLLGIGTGSQPSIGISSIQ